MVSRRKRGKERKENDDDGKDIYRAGEVMSVFAMKAITTLTREVPGNFYRDLYR